MDQLVAALRDSLAQDQARLDAAQLHFSSVSDGAAPWLLEAMLVLMSAPELGAAVRQQKNVGKFYHKRVLSKMQRFSGGSFSPGHTPPLYSLKQYHSDVLR